MCLVRAARVPLSNYSSEQNCLCVVGFTLGAGALLRADFIRISHSYDSLMR